MMSAEEYDMEKRTLGKGGPQVSAIGLGCMGMSGMYGASDEAESVATIDAALDAGVTLFDTGDFYGMGHNEMLLGRALEGRPRDSFFVQVKFGAMRGPNGSWIGYDARPNAMRNFLAYSLKRLKLDYIDLYQPARLDPNVPIEDTIGAIADMVKAGYVRHIGVSELGSDTIRRAHAVHPIRALQIEYAMITRGIEREILPTCRELGISVVPYGVFSRGLLTGFKPSESSKQQGDLRAFLPRFTADNYERNQQVIESLRQFAADKGITVAQLAVAWVLARGQDIVPLIGARRRTQLQDALGALNVKLTPEDLQRIEQIAPADAIAGTRYDAHQMQMLDSER
jgi:aryl-alcohol dehydrogenase-like predicted oxidoreductase